MLTDKNRTDAAEIPEPNKGLNIIRDPSYSGFMILQLRIGESFLIGDTLVIVNEIQTGARVLIAVKARPSTKIERLKR